MRFCGMVGDGNDGVANLLGLGFEFDLADLAGLAVFNNLCRRLFRVDAQFALHLGQGALSGQIFGGAVLV